MTLPFVRSFRVASFMPRAAQRPRPSGTAPLARAVVGVERSARRSGLGASAATPLARAVVGVCILAAACFGAFAAPPPTPPAAVQDEIFAALSAERARLGAPPLARPAALQAAAEERAADLAALPAAERAAGPPPLDPFLAAQGVPGVGSADEKTILAPETRDAAAALLAQWRGYGGAWGAALGPRVRECGIGYARTDDGFMVMVAILVVPLPRLSPLELAQLERRLFDEVNRRRQAAGGGLPLRWDERLAAAARAHSEDMAARRYFEHVSPEGRTPAARVQAAGVPYRRVAENIGESRNQEDPVRAAADGWMNSPGHRANIVDPAFVESGLGAAADADGALYFTQLFIAPPPAAQ